MQRIRASHGMKGNIWHYIFWDQLQQSYTIVIAKAVNSVRAESMYVLLAALSSVPSIVFGIQQMLNSYLSDKWMKWAS